MKIAILGDGGWGTALSVLLNRRGQEVTLWSAFPEYAKVLVEKHENVKFLPGIPLDRSISISTDLKASCEENSILVFAIPSQYLRNILYKTKSYSFQNKVVVSVAKGIEKGTLLRPSQIIESQLGSVRLVALSGPSHAEEVARNIPTVVVAASRNREAARLVQENFKEDRFRVYTSDDVVGVELGGSLKNVIAIAAGVCDGLGFGSNTKAALLARGLFEITRFGVRLGANPNTFFGLSGLGDLVTTCISAYGRNRKVGELLGQGKRLDEILKGMEMVAEGVDTTRSVLELSKKVGVSVPIMEEVYKILFEGKNPLRAVEDLMMRDAGMEMEYSKTKGGESR